MLRRLAMLVMLPALALGGTSLAAGAAGAPGGPSATPAAGQTTPPPNPQVNFVSHCRFTRSLADDPIVYPGVSGAAHMHDFFANRTTDAFSTLASLQAGTTSCNRPADTAAYWTPSLYENGVKVNPTSVAAYYLPKGKELRSIKAFPSGLKVIAGPGERTSQFACRTRDRDVASSTTEVPSCPTGSHLVVRIFFPDCWDGINLDSADHRSHMAYSARGRCPMTHPVPVPMLRLGVHFENSNGGSDVTFSSGAPSTMHADFFNAWNQPALERLVRQCLNAGVHCGARGPAAT